MNFLDKVGLTHWTSKFKSYVNNKIEDLKTLLSKDIEKKQDELTAGDNIKIDSNTVSVVETAEKKFVSDEEKLKWDEKLDKTSDISKNTVDYLQDGKGMTLINVLQYFLGDIDESLIDCLKTPDIGYRVASLDSNEQVPLDELPDEALKDTTYTAGKNIAIDSNNIISATDTTYDLSPYALKTDLDKIDVTSQLGDYAKKDELSTKQDKLTAGANISIDSNNKISATVPEVNYPVKSVNSKTGAVTITKSDLGLGSVENIGIIILSEAEYKALSDTEKARTDKLYGTYVTGSGTIPEKV